MRFICLFVSKCLQFYFYSGHTDRQTDFEFYIYIDVVMYSGCNQRSDKRSKVPAALSYVVYIVLFSCYTTW